jgi:hypothetical protein
MTTELYVLAHVDAKGNIRDFVRKGRNWSISGYDSIGAARRGLSQSKRSYRSDNIKIVKATGLEIVQEEQK